MEQDWILVKAAGLVMPPRRPPGPGRVTAVTKVDLAGNFIARRWEVGEERRRTRRVWAALAPPAYIQA